MTYIEKSPEYIGAPDRFNIARKMANYVIESSLEMENPEIVIKAQQIHGISYVKSGYVSQEAVTEAGVITPELDSARGDGGINVAVKYLLARENDKPINEAGASVRLIDVTDRGDISDLPTCNYFKDSDVDIAAKINRTIESLDGAVNVREIAALSTATFSDSRGSYEIIRAVMQNSLMKKTDYDLNEFYLVSLTEKSLKPIVRMAGKKAVQILGDPVRVYPTDPRQKEVYLTPLLLSPNDAISGLIEELGQSKSRIEIESLKQRILFLYDGLKPEQIKEEDFEFIKKLLSNK